MVWEFMPDNFHPRWHEHPLGERKKYKPFELVTKKGWGGFPPLFEDGVDHPVYNLRVVETHTNQCDSKGACSALLQSLQFDQMRAKLPDINYNFLIARDGMVYEGRGWFVDCNMAPKFKRIKQDCFTIAMIGSFDKTGTDIPRTMNKVLKRIISRGLDLGYIDCCYRHISFRNFED